MLTGGIGQWADYGARITGLWMDLEAGKLVQVRSGVPNFVKRDAMVSVSVLNEGRSETRGINLFPRVHSLVPRVKSLALIGVSGTIPTRSLRIEIGTSRVSGISVRRL